jgi:uncharacterized protein YecT (DUF1311 family)
MKLSSLIAFLAIAGSISVEAEEGFQCKYDGNQQEMNACAVRDFKVADDTLNERYKVVKSMLSLAKQSEFYEQHRAWLNEREPTCKTEAKLSEGGSIWPLVFYSCLEVITKKRIDEIENWETFQ